MHDCVTYLIHDVNSSRVNQVQTESNSNIHQIFQFFILLLINELLFYFQI